MSQKQVIPDSFLASIKPPSKDASKCNVICHEILLEFLAELNESKLGSKPKNLEVTETSQEPTISNSKRELVTDLSTSENRFESLILLLSEMYEKKVQMHTIEKVIYENSDKPHSGLSYLISLVACTIVKESEIVQMAIELSRQILADIPISNPKYISIVTLCLFAIYKNTKEHELLQDAFILAHYANMVDPQAEILMVRIGEKIIKRYQCYPSLFESQFVEFVARRIGTCNTGRMNNDLKNIFASIFLHNHFTNNRRHLMKDPYKFTKHLKKTCENKVSEASEHLYRFKISKDTKYWYKVIQCAYNDTQFHALRACRLTNAFYVAQSLGISNELDLNERLILLSNSVHAFLLSDRCINVSDSSNLELSGNNFNVYAFALTAYNLYNFLVDEQDKIEEDLPFNFDGLNIHQTFPKLLIKHLTLILYDIACRLSKEKEERITSITLLKDRCLDGIVSNITQFLDIISPERKFDAEFTPIYQFVETKNMRFNLLFQPCEMQKRS